MRQSARWQELFRDNKLKELVAEPRFRLTLHKDP